MRILGVSSEHLSLITIRHLSEDTEQAVRLRSGVQKTGPAGKKTLGVVNIYMVFKVLKQDKIIER